MGAPAEQWEKLADRPGGQEDADKQHIPDLEALFRGPPRFP
jgi:hypothetical protein